MVSGRVWRVGGGPDPKKIGFNRLLIHISNMDRYQCLKLVYSDRLSSFFTKLPKNNIGASWVAFFDNLVIFSPNCQK